MSAAPQHTEEGHEAFLGRVYGYASGALTTNAIVIGDRLGLYDMMKKIGPCATEELACALDLNERWVREWLYQQAAAKVVTTDEKAARFWLTQVQQDVLVNESGPDASPYFGIGGLGAIPAFGDKLDKLCASFKSGVGLKYDEYGEAVSQATCRELAVWPRFFLVKRISEIPGLKEKLDKGCNVCDVGCGAGEALRILGQAFPLSTFHGFDTSEVALQKARDLTSKAGLENVTFINPGDHEEGMRGVAKYDIAITFDAVHDMARPDLVMVEVRKALKDDGVWIIGDFRVGHPDQNIHGHTFGAFLYGFSVHLCMSSALSEQGGLGLGTCGFGKHVAERMLLGAGFRSVEELDWGHDLNAYYLVKA